MMDTKPQIELEPDNGFIEIVVRDSNGQEHMKLLDVWEVNNRIAFIQEECRDKPIWETHQRYVELLQELGYPRVSQRTANGVVNAILGRMEELEKKPDPAGKGSFAESPDGTESIQPIGQPPN